jgi:hypothetical protein
MGLHERSESNGAGAVHAFGIHAMITLHGAPPEQIMSQYVGQCEIIKKRNDLKIIKICWLLVFFNLTLCFTNWRFQ